MSASIGHIPEESLVGLNSVNLEGHGLDALGEELKTVEEYGPVEVIGKVVDALVVTF
jgi:hypothetical protein